jgi:hypothetical protein
MASENCNCDLDHARPTAFPASRFEPPMAAWEGLRRSGGEDRKRNRPHDGVLPIMQLGVHGNGNVISAVHHGFAIDDCRLAFEPRCHGNQSRIPRCPIVAVHRISMRGTVFNDQLGAVAIMFDFVQPLNKGGESGRQKEGLEQSVRARSVLPSELRRRQPRGRSPVKSSSQRDNRACRIAHSDGPPDGTTV